MIRALYHRLYQNYFMGSRIASYADLVRGFADAGYEFLTMTEFAHKISRGESVARKTCILRCDVDSDVETTRQMFEATHGAGAKATFYFRLSTLQASLMQDIAASSSEVGYHFEEVATVSKRLGLSTSAAVHDHLDTIRREFCRNVDSRYIPAAGAPPKTVASHGDFVNRWLGVTNSILLSDDIRARYGIVAATSDGALARALTRRFSDAAAPIWWKPARPTAANSEHEDCLYILVHPRQWMARPVENTLLDVGRAAEGLSFAVRRKLSRAAGR